MTYTACFSGGVIVNIITCVLCGIIMVGTIETRHRVNVLEAIVKQHPLLQSPQKSQLSQQPSRQSLPNKSPGDYSLWHPPMQSDAEVSVLPAQYAPDSQSYHLSAGREMLEGADSVWPYPPTPMSRLGVPLQSYQGTNHSSRVMTPNVQSSGTRDRMT